jgi:hypothetical protein
MLERLVTTPAYASRAAALAAAITGDGKEASIRVLESLLA